ncbi:hypothetical protein [Marinobacter salarius]|jgi:hypothetical protein|uniref:hypothetical protein n=1 Tax=Marinobacter salarius TaxID=1420917 RepID=UPI003BAAFBA3
MKYQSLYKFYWFGTCLRYLQDAKKDIPIHGPGLIMENIESFFDLLDELELHVTKGLAHSKLDSWIQNQNNLGDDALLSVEGAGELVEYMRSIRETLEIEIDGIGAYTPTTKRLDLKRLLDAVPDFFAPNIYINLPEIAQYDFSEGGKCIAFERPTAAAFHILRATESVLRYYYENMIKSSRISSRMWGPIVNELRKRNLTKKYGPLNNHLDNIRDSFRNPTQHPEAMYDIHEVQDLWAVCIDVNNRMIKILKDEGRI